MDNKVTMGCFPNETFDCFSNPWSVNPKTGIWGKYENGQEVLNGIEKINEQRLSEYSGILECDNVLYFLPGWQEHRTPHIKIFNLITKKTDYIELKQKDLGGLKSIVLFSKGAVIDKYVFLFGTSYPAIVRINTTNREIDYIEDFNISNTNDVNGYFQITQCAIKDGYIYLTCTKSKNIVKINAETLEMESVFLDLLSQGTYNIVSYDEERFLVGGTGENSNYIYIWNEKSQQIENQIALKNPPKRFPVSYFLQGKNRDVYLFPGDNWEPQKMEIYLLKYDTRELVNTHIMERFSSNQVYDYIWGQEVQYACWKDEQTLLFVTGKDLLWHEYNVLTDEHVEYEVSAKKDDISEKVVKKYYQSLTNNRIPLKERDISLQQFLA